MPLIQPSPPRTAGPAMMPGVQMPGMQPPNMGASPMPGIPMGNPNIRPNQPYPQPVPGQMSGMGSMMPPPQQSPPNMPQNQVPTRQLFGSQSANASQPNQMSQYPSLMAAAGQQMQQNPSQSAPMGGGSQMGGNQAPQQFHSPSPMGSNSLGSQPGVGLQQQGMMQQPRPQIPNPMNAPSAPPMSGYSPGMQAPMGQQSPGTAQGMRQGIGQGIGQPQMRTPFSMALQQSTPSSSQSQGQPVDNAYNRMKQSPPTTTEGNGMNWDRPVQPQPAAAQPAQAKPAGSPDPYSQLSWGTKNSWGGGQQAMYMPNPNDPHTTRQFGQLGVQASKMIGNANPTQLLQLFHQGGGSIGDFYNMIRDNPNSADFMKSIGYGSLVN